MKAILDDYHKQHEEQQKAINRERERNDELEERIALLESELEEKQEEMSRLRKELQKAERAKLKSQRELKMRRHELYGLLESLDKSSRLMERSCEVLVESQLFGMSSLDHLDHRINETQFREKGQGISGRVNNITHLLDTQLKENNSYLRATPCPSQHSDDESVSSFEETKTELPSSQNLMEHHHDLPFRDISQDYLNTTRFADRVKGACDESFELHKPTELESLRSKNQTLETQLLTIEHQLEYVRKEGERWKHSYEDLVQRVKMEEESKKMKKAGHQGGGSSLADIEQLRKLQEQLFEVVNLLRQEIDEDDANAPARLVFKRNALAQEYPQTLQVRMSREVHQRIREMKKGGGVEAPFSIYFSNQSDIRMAQNSTILLQDDSIMLPLQRESSIERVLKRQKVAVGVQTEGESGRVEDLLTMLEVEAHTVEKLLRR